MVRTVTRVPRTVGSPPLIFSSHTINAAQSSLTRLDPPKAVGWTRLGTPWYSFASIPCGRRAKGVTICYTPANLRLVLGFQEALIGALSSRVTVSDTLVTKIMLGVFGCVPAFDTNFCTGFGVSTFNERALGLVAQYYADNQAIIDRYRVRRWTSPPASHHGSTTPGPK